VKRTSFALATMLAVFPSALSGQTRSGASATEVARGFFTAQSDGRWLDAARLLDLRAFEAYRQDAIRTSRLNKGFVGPTPDQVMAKQPDMPRAVAEYVAKQYSQAADSDALSMEFARTTSSDSLASMPAEQAAARWLEARDPRWQLERSRAHLPADCVRPPIGPTVKPSPIEVLGNAITALAAPGRTDSLSYVLFRDVSVSQSSRIGNGMPPGVLTLTRVDGQWKILPLPDVGFAGGMRSFPGFGCVKVGVQPPE
jgi:hypothetical protein